MMLDIEFVRRQFDQLSDNPEFVFCANAGGSCMANQVSKILRHYNAHTRVQPYEGYAASSAAGAAMDRAISGWADALNISSDELTIGPSTSMNTYILAQAMGEKLRRGDEIIVTNQDHEANNGVWRRKAEEKGAVIKQWSADKSTGLLNPDDLYALLSDKTAWVFFTHCSNIAGTHNPVEDIVRKIKNCSNDIKIFVDAVAHAPHHIPDLKSLGVDGYGFSLYKVYGPHQGLMYVSQNMLDSLAPQCHYFNRQYQNKLFNPAGPQHAQVAGCAGVLDYFSEIYNHHYGDDGSPVGLQKKLKATAGLIMEHENNLAQPILDYLSGSRHIRLIGKAHVKDGDRAPTIAFKHLKLPSREICKKMQDRNIGCESGHFYAHRLISDLGIDPEDGVVRISLVHYSNQDEVEKILTALDQAI